MESVRKTTLTGTPVFARTAVLIRTMTLAIILLTWGQVTQAALQATEQAYELNVHMVERWPLGDEGSIVLYPCEDCDRVVLRVNAATRYGNSLSGPDISRNELLQLKATLSGGQDAFVYIFYRPDDQTATRIVLDADD